MNQSEIIFHVLKKKKPWLHSDIWWHISAITCQIIMSTIQIYELKDCEIIRIRGGSILGGIRGYLLSTN